jgi:Flp pilus assembly protein TadG
MQTPLITKPVSHERTSERGVTMVFVALAMIAIIAMAALSIDVITLYLAREEAQRSADEAALAAARILSVAGITGDPTNATGNWGAICGPNGVATHAAQALIAQNTVGRVVPGTINVTYAAGNGGAISSSTDCQTLASNSAFGVNPMVTVQLTRASLPTFFSRIWGNSGNSVSATATAEAFNPSSSGTVGNQTSGTLTPVQPRCVKPWVVPNLDPRDPAHPGCTTNCVGFVDRATGAIQRPGISLNGDGATGVIGETFWLPLDCKHGNPSYCDLVVQPQANYPDPLGWMKGPPNVLGLPGQVGTPVTAVPSCSTGDPYEEAIEGCDSPANYQCGVPNANAVDLTKHNPGVNSVTDAVECLTHQTDATNLLTSSGQDYLSENPLGAPSSYPFQILAGSGNPLGASFTDTPITSSASIVSMPIYDQIGTPIIPTNAITNLTFVGFLQVFVNAVDVNGNRLVTVLNVTGCGNGTNPTSSNPVAGTSPVPIRLITPP